MEIWQFYQVDKRKQNLNKMSKEQAWSLESDERKGPRSI